MFFVVSTGRCGSQSIARMLDSHPQLECIHEAHALPLMKLAAEFSYGDISKDDAKKMLIKILSRAERDTYGESNQKFSFLLEPLTELYPQAKFIWLIRDGRRVVASAVHRGWYGPKGDAQRKNPPLKKGWTFYKIWGDRADPDIDEDRWNKMSAFERNCWYWSFTNRTIKSGLETIPPDKKILLNLDQMHNISSILEFLGVDLLPISPVHSNKSRGGVPKHWSKWTHIQRSHFEEYCGSVMNEMFPGWSWEGP